MIQKIGNKLQVQIEEGAEKKKKVTFANVIDDAPEEKILELGEIMAELSPENSYLDGVILTSQTRYTQ